MAILADYNEEERIKEIVERLKKNYPDARIALRFRNPYELLVATILSAQTTDKKVNEVTPKLFERYPTPLALAQADIKDVEEIIKPLGFYRQKAKYIVGAARVISEKFNGKVPDNMEELTLLPGVARKTANIVLSNAYGKVEGIAVDTHVRRISKKLGLTDNTDPDKIEKDLMAKIPKDEWFKFTYTVIEHGRNICKAPRPKCSVCFLNDICPSASIF
ncbi:MAG: endonuclease III [Actinobacteria bacterium]|nr:endonuclease III [Actinomycetota bacterium]